MWWRHSGYAEVQSAPQRYRLVDTDALVELVGAGSLAALQAAQRDWVDTAIAAGRLRREPDWSEALAIGSAAFAERVKTSLVGRSDKKRIVTGVDAAWVVREPAATYAATGRQAGSGCALQAAWGRGGDDAGASPAGDGDASSRGVLAAAEPGAERSGQMR
jgi:hypothetical protein